MKRKRGRPKSTDIKKEHIYKELTIEAFKNSPKKELLVSEIRQVTPKKGNFNELCFHKKGDQRTESKLSN
jgi:hypothetical protein